MAQEDLVQQLKALGDMTRLHILQLLPATNRCEDVYNVSELAAELGVPQPTISHHLKILHQAKLVRCQRMCRDVYYWIDQDEMTVVQTALHTMTAGHETAASDKG